MIAAPRWRRPFATAALLLLAATASVAAPADQPPASGPTGPFASTLRSLGVRLGTNAEFGSRLAFEFSPNVLNFARAQAMPPGQLSGSGAPPAAVFDPALVPTLPADAQLSVGARQPAGPPPPGSGGPDNPPPTLPAACNSDILPASSSSDFWENVIEIGLLGSTAVEQNAPSGSAGPQPVSEPGALGGDVLPVTEAVGQFNVHDHPSEWCPPDPEGNYATEPFGRAVWIPVLLILLGFAIFWAIRGWRTP